MPSVRAGGLAERLAEGVDEGARRGPAAPARHRGDRFVVREEVGTAAEAARVAAAMPGRPCTQCEKIPLPGEEGISAAIHALRIFGVLICVQLGLDIVTDCPCFLSLAKEKTGEELKATLE